MESHKTFLHRLWERSFFFSGDTMTMTIHKPPGIEEIVTVIVSTSSVDKERNEYLSTQRPLLITGGIVEVSEQLIDMIESVPLPDSLKAQSNVEQIKQDIADAQVKETEKPVKKSINPWDIFEDKVKELTEQGLLRDALTYINSEAKNFEKAKKYKTAFAKYRYDTQLAIQKAAMEEPEPVKESVLITSPPVAQNIIDDRDEPIDPEEVVETEEIEPEGEEVFSDTVEEENEETESNPFE